MVFDETRNDWSETKLPIFFSFFFLTFLIKNYLFDLVVEFD
jgi:hypothetical protein